MSTDPAFQLMYVDDVDIDTDECLVEEMYWSTIQRHPYLVLDQTATTNIYGEPEAEPVYTLFATSIPIHANIDPEEEDLNKYGYDRTRDAIFWFSSKILRDAGLAPKVGDRINFTFTDVAGNSVVEQFELMEVSPMDFVRQAKVSYQVTASGVRTHKAKKP